MVTAELHILYDIGGYLIVSEWLMKIFAAAICNENIGSISRVPLTIFC